MQKDLKTNEQTNRETDLHTERLKTGGQTNKDTNVYIGRG